MKLPGIEFDYLTPKTHEEFASWLVKDAPWSDFLNPRKLMMLGYVMLLHKKGRFKELGTYHVAARINWRTKIIGHVSKQP